jgi:hypothetical protein
LTIVTESLVFHRLSEQQSKRWDGFYDLLIVMNKTEKSKESNGTSERRSYLYIILKTRKKKSLSHFLTGGNNWRSNAQAHPNTQLIMKKNENVIFFFWGGQSSLTVIGGHRWSFSIDARREKERQSVYALLMQRMIENGPICILFNCLSTVTAVWVRPKMHY